MHRQTELQLAHVGDKTATGGGVVTVVSGIVAWAAEASTRFGDFAMSALGLAFMGFVVTVVSTIVTIYFKRREDKRAEELLRLERLERHARMHKLLGPNWRETLQDVDIYG